MCTVSIIPLADGLRLVANRDESRRRSPALPPAVVDAGAVRAIMPIDPEGGGTWVAGTDMGLAFALLNLNIDGPAPLPASQSRGSVIPLLLSVMTPAEAVMAMARKGPVDCGPFRLIVAGDGEVCEFRSDTGRVGRQRLSRPLMFTSSSVGDRVVQGPRQDLFDRLMAGAPAEWAARQDRFQAHRWPAHPELSVTMQRGDARTVSRTVVEVRTGVVRVTYAELTAPTGGGNRRRPRDTGRRPRPSSRASGCSPER